MFYTSDAVSNAGVRMVSAVSRTSPVFLLILFLAACGQRFGAAPVINGKTGGMQSVSSSQRDRLASKVRVKRGDSLYKIAREQRISLRQLIEVNHLRPPYILQPGQILKLPRNGTHIVTAGETIYTVAHLYKMHPGRLVRLNNIPAPYRLLPGKRLQISAKSSTGTSAISRSTRRSQAKSKKIVSFGTDDSRNVVSSRSGVLSHKRFIWPVNGRLISKFGSVGKGLKNDGINILAQSGTPVRAAQTGVVAYAGNELRGFGNLLLVRHSGGWISAYAHNSKLLVATGDSVSRGQVISRVGNTGSVNIPQLHFELRRGKRPVNPERYLSGSNSQNRG